MHSICRFLLVAALCCAGCGRGKQKGKTAEAETAALVAVGKLVITPPLLDASKGSRYEAAGGIGQELDALGGAEIRRRAEEFLKKNRPEIQPAPVAIEVQRMKESNIVSVTGRGASPEYSGALVDAVMEAYLLSVRPAEAGAGASLTAEIDGAEKGLKEAERAWTSFRLEHDFSRLDSELSAAERRQKRIGVAEEFYQRELDWAAKLTIEQDLTRRQASPILPSEMPAELATLVRTTLTTAELAYLSALRGANAPAIEAARKEAEKDREDRARSMRKQMEIGGDLARTTGAEIARLRSLQAESERLQARHRAAEAAYAEVKSREKNMEARLNDSVHPMVFITERASKPKEGLRAPSPTKGP